MARARHIAEAAMFVALQRAASVLPARLLRGLGATLGTIAFRLDRRHRRITLANLERALGDTRTNDERRDIARRCWRHFGTVLLGALAFPTLDPGAIGKTIRVHGLEHLRRAYESGRGVVVFTGHYGNWELAGVVQGHLGLPLSLLARPLDNPSLERRLDAIRSCSGNRVVHKRDAVRAMIRVLRSGNAVAFMIDQDARADGVFVPFFGTLASTTPTLGLLAVRTGAALVPCRSLPRADGSHDITYGPEVAVRRDGDRQTEILRLTTRCTAILEGWIRENPEYWLWMHRRWKTRPPDGSATARE